MAEQQEEDVGSLPLEERFVHKAWKVRKEAYEAAAREFAASPDEAAPVFTPFHLSPELWKGAAADANVAAQVEGLAALCAYLKHGGPAAAARSRPHTVQAIYEKAVASTRPAAKQHAVEALLLYVENDKPDLVVDELLPALSHKQPKVAAASLAAITALYHNFGTRVVDPKPVLKQLPKAFGHADKNMRAEAQAAAVELYRWHRDAIKTHFWADLKPVQQADLDKLFDKAKDEPGPQQQRFTRAQQVQQAQQAAAPAHDSAFDLAEPVDVVAKMPADFYDLVASTKWKERKDTLDALFAVVDTPRIKDTHVDDLVRALAKCMKDANVAVVTVAAHCVEKLALGLRKAFAKHRSTLLEPLLERLKEKKQSVTEALAAALDAVFQSSSMSDCLETTLAFLVHKNPNVKAETAKAAAATSAVGKKVVGGAKKPLARKLAAPAAAPLEEEGAPSTVTRPASKAGAVAKPAALAAPNGVKLAGALKRPGLASPQPRKLGSPLSQPSDDDRVAPSPSTSKFGAGRGLTSKPLGRAAGPPKSPPSSAGQLPAPAPALSALSAVQLAELEELRADKDRLTALTDSLRSSNTKLLAEIAELQNQNAQLIEDHTRDVLQIKAKETQLTRARGESDVLRGEMDSVRKECERYKRELSRLGRESLGRDRDEVRRARQDEALDLSSLRPQPQSAFATHSSLSPTDEKENHNASRAPDADEPRI
ncbi:hypothetical protein DV737_g2014, partial [Chaetothyriales sp. CBS 132003]